MSSCELGLNKGPQGEREMHIPINQIVLFLVLHKAHLTSSLALAASLVTRRWVTLQEPFIISVPCVSTKTGENLDFCF